MIATIAGATLAVVGVLGLVYRAMARMNRNWDEWRGDWYGAAARPGKAAEPGVMERLARIETALDGVGDRVTTVEHQMFERITSFERQLAVLAHATEDPAT